MAEYVDPSSEYTSRVFGLGTGLTGTVRFRLVDNDSTANDPIYGPSTAGIVEDPSGSGSYVFLSSAVAELAPATEGKYSRVWDSGAATELVPDEDMIVLAGSSSLIISGDTYGTVDELARRLKINNPTVEQEDQMTLVLLMATAEIDAEIDLAEDADALAGAQLAIAVEVCYQRSIEQWRATPFGLIGIDSDFGAVHTSRNTWERYAFMLAPLKNQWGVG